MVGELHRFYSRTEHFNIARVDPVEMQPEVVVSWPTFYEGRGEPFGQHCFLNLGPLEINPDRDHVSCPAKVVGIEIAADKPWAFPLCSLRNDRRDLPQTRLGV